VALALAIEPGDDRSERVAVGHAVELGRRVDQEAVAAEGQAVLAGSGLGGVECLVRRDHPPDGQVEGAREGVVALVVRGHGHDRAGAYSIST